MDEPRGFNVLITGTPATGKTSLAQMVAEECGLTHVEVGRVIKDSEFYSHRDEALDTHVVEEDDEDRLLDHLEPIMVRGSAVADYHSSELFPRRWFHLVVVLRCETEVLFDRLVARRYAAAKRQENMEAEITAVCEQEALESYDAERVMVRPSNKLEDMVDTVEAVRAAKEAWEAQAGAGVVA